MLFIEKIAFEQPYQATKIYDLTELLDMLSQRSEYFGEEEEPGPFVYINGEYIGELKPHENNAFAVRKWYEHLAFGSRTFVPPESFLYRFTQTHKRYTE